MAEFIRLLAFGAATFCIGMTAILSILFSIASHHATYNSGEGCLGKLLTAILLTAALFFFYIAVSGAQG